MLDFRGYNVVVIGDVMLDRYVHGSVERISPEAPVPILNKNNEENRLGGAANVALNLHALGAKPILIGTVGNDSEGRLLAELLSLKGLKKQYLITDRSRSTTLKCRVVSDGQQLIRIDREDLHPVNKNIEDDLFETLKTLLQTIPIDAIVLQDYNKGLLTPRLIRGIIDFSSVKDIPTLVDPKIDNFFQYKGATVIKPNKKEVELALKRTLTTKQLINDTYLVDLRKALQCECLFTTLSKDGIAFFTADKVGYAATHPRKIIDVSGAGDTVLATIACSIVAGYSYKTAAKIANVAGGQVCSRPGVTVISLADLESELNQRDIKVN